MSKAWSHLYNADHIDWVLQSLKENPELWTAAWSVAWDAARNASKDAVWYAARNAVWYAAGDAASYAATSAAWEAVSALVAYDDCDSFLDMSYEKLQVWAVLSKDPRAILLLPMVYVKEKLNEQSMATPIQCRSLKENPELWTAAKIGRNMK